MIDRLRELRRLLGLNQGEFAQKIGIKQGSLSDIERGKVGLSNANIMLICKTFNVSEDWIRNGLGEPFNNEYEHRQDLSDLEKDILTKFNLLDDVDRKAIENIIDSLYQKATKEEFSKDNDIEAELETNHKELVREKRAISLRQYR